MNARQVWQAALGELQVKMSPPNFETWLRQAAAVSMDDRHFVLRAHSTFAAEWIDRRLRPKIEETLHHIVGRPLELEVIVAHAPRAGSAGLNDGAPAPSPTMVEERRATMAPAVAELTLATVEPDAPVAAPASPVAAFPLGDWTPNPTYTFETFTVGKSNETAHAAAMSVAEDPGRGYNPLFIYGGVGLGKTHLLHAIANVVVRRGLRTLYVSAEEFTNQMVNAIREHRNEEFRQRYRTIEVLLVDDVQFIAGKEGTQEEFFHTFNALHGVGHQIVLTSDRPPKAIANLAERLQSRFAWGIAVDVQLPDLETRRAILQAKAARQGGVVPEDVIQLLANAIQSNIRELEGGLNRVVAYSRLTNQPLSTSMARAAIEDLVQSRQRRIVATSDVLDAVCRYYRIEARALRGKARDKETVIPRQVAMYLMRQKTQSSLVDIGRELGGRDHSTVINGCARIQSEVESDVQLRRDLNAIEEILRQAVTR